ncbi:MAG: GIY-YIG nuclease family protein [Oleispira sp.]
MIWPFSCGRLECSTFSSEDLRRILIVFTITNDVTDEVYVGTTKDSVDERWKQYQEAAELDHTAARLFKDIRDFGVKSFTPSEYAVAFDREDLKDLFEEAMEEHQGISLVGVKTIKPKPVKVAAPKKVAPKKTTAAKARNAHGPVTTILAKPKISSGRTNNASKERAIKEAISEEKAERETKKLMKASAEAQEMRDIMARLDNRGSSLKKR